ncbi:hypothetical protein GCK32_017856, partial [Trichostrongylus colubriformis]
MQTMHHDMEHRLMDSSIQNPLEEHELGVLESSQRIADEVDRRVAMLNDTQRVETIFGGRSGELPGYFQDILHCKQLTIRRNTKQTKVFMTQANSMLKSF